MAAELVSERITQVVLVMKLLRGEQVRQISVTDEAWHWRALLESWSLGKAMGESATQLTDPQHLEMQYLGMSTKDSRYGVELA